MHYELKDAITMAVAVLGAVLGLFNTWHVYDQKRLRLRVTPKWAHPVGPGGLGPPMVCIEVVNLSVFAVSLHEIGFTLRGRTDRLAVTQPDTLDGKPLARTLEPRRSVTGYFDIQSLSGGIEKAYARTECGEVAYGATPALKQIREALS